MSLKDVLREKIEAHRSRTKTLVTKHGDVKVGEVTIAQAIGGARGVRCLVTDVSYLDPEEGIRFRGKTIPQVMSEMPKPKGKDYPYVEGFWYFLQTGDVPTQAQAQEVVEDFRARSPVAGGRGGLQGQEPGAPVRVRHSAGDAAGLPPDGHVLRRYRRHATRVEVREVLP
jgi:hypothetical protein